MTEKEQVLICEAKLTLAMKNGDVAMLDFLLDERLIFHIPSGQIITKEMDLENYRSGRMVVHQIFAEDPMVSIFGDVSIVSVVIHLQAEYSGLPVGGEFRYLRFWKKSKGNSWKVIGGSGIKIQ
ncbi:nuclear transport factor 2 family protein [Algoriphagus confluentis]|uniref:DUF4440 domain-containing protein n=1 Tax=Algoriphagus confluentis TaxID=1697556 RepID=A0ABQ6PVB4_9BACT|nr:hypothetical protein Aconfl_33250 [Algoriphagus confluentis]